MLEELKQRIDELEGAHAREIEGLRAIWRREEARLMEEASRYRALSASKAEACERVQQQYDQLVQEMGGIRREYQQLRASVRDALVDQDELIRIIKLLDAEIEHNAIGVSGTEEEAQTMQMYLKKVRSTEPLVLCRLLDLERFEPGRVFPICTAMLSNIRGRVEDEGAVLPGREALLELIEQRTELVAVLTLYFGLLGDGEYRRVVGAIEGARRVPGATLLGLLQQHAQEPTGAVGATGALGAWLEAMWPK